MPSHFYEKETSRRQRRVGMIIHRALSDILKNTDPTITFSEVRLSRDLKIAHVYVIPSFGLSVEEKAEKLQQLKKTASPLRKKLATSVYLKYVPQLKFHPDERLELNQQLDQILSSITSSTR